jgi:hypothetical protein
LSSEEPTADRGQQHVVFHVEDARGVVGAFEEGAEAGEIVDVVAQHRAVDRAAHQRGLLADQVQHLGQVAFADLARQRLASAIIQQVDRLPHLAGQRRAHQLGVVARRR